jgi:hypothetical protein
MTMSPRTRLLGLAGLLMAWLFATEAPTSASPQTRPAEVKPPAAGSADAASIRKEEVLEVQVLGTAGTEPTIIRPVRFAGNQFLGGKEFFRFQNDRRPEESYLVPPSAIVAIRVRPAGAPAAVGFGAMPGVFGGGAAVGGAGGVAAPRGPMIDARFDRLAGGKDVWERPETADSPQQTVFDRIAQHLGITSGQITRQQFKDYYEKLFAELGGFGAVRGARGGPLPAGPFGGVEKKLDDVLSAIQQLDSRLRSIESRLPREGRLR